MKQLHVVGSYPVGTHTFVLWQLHGALARGHEVHVLAANRGNEAGQAMVSRLGLQGVRATCAGFRDYPALGLDLRRFERRFAAAANSALYGRLLAERRKTFFCDLVSRPGIAGVDLVQVHFVQWAVEVGIPLARLLDKPCVVTAHGAVSDTNPDFLKHVQAEADAIVLVSDGELEAWARCTGSDRKLSRVWNGLPLPSLPAARPPHAQAGTLEIVTIGRLAQEKRIADAIDAVARVDASGPLRCNLSIFGEGPLREPLGACIRELGMDDRIRLEGNVPHDRIMARLAASDLLVHAADVEPFGMAMIEAMAVGLPVVAARSSGAVQIVADGSTGLLFACGDVDGLAAGIRTLGADGGLRRAMGEAGRERAARLFSLDSHIAGMERLWETAIARHRGDSGHTTFHQPGERRP
ncbi:glycosyltransferase family 4 protein [Thauera sinica]|uniref:Glycosyltransferase family 4 protein n=1 Tax=Thauera sinica TaxID=2665146 RepID=A0ABW1AM21_9RHOO|nr:glycosyltransferase family 4 protein [Thauera sp. K11]ATE60914.1 hypothetical protein CCZ27_14055 [Thauera sp. K11]